MKRDTVLLALSGFLLAGISHTCAHAQSASHLSAKDKIFLTQAVQGDVAQVELAKLALHKSSNKDVREFAEKMIHDHGNLMDDLKPYTAQMRVKPPTSMNGQQLALKRRLAALSGSAFDRSYVQSMVEGHQKDVKQFKEEQDTTQDADLKNTVGQEEQMIEQHLGIISTIAKNNNIDVPS